jgi:hypothetical protein
MPTLFRRTIYGEYTERTDNIATGFGFTATPMSLSTSLSIYEEHFCRIVSYSIVNILLWNLSLLNPQVKQVKRLYLEYVHHKKGT